MFDWRPESFPDRGVPPLRDIDPEARYPAVESGVFSGGGRWVMVRVPELPVRTVTWVLPGGHRLDRGRPGLTRMTYALLTEETVHRSRQQLAVDLERVMAHVRGSSNEDAVRVTLTHAGERVNEAMELFGEILHEPGYSRQLVRREAVRALQQIQAYRADAAYLARTAFRRLLFGDHPYHLVDPDPELLASLDRWHVLEHYLQTFRPRSGTWILTGDVRDEDLQTLETLLQGPPDAPVKVVDSPAEMPAVDRGVWVHRPGSVQTVFVLGVALHGMDPEWWPAYQVANTILGGGASARLFLRLREEKGYTYGAYSGIHFFRHNCMWTASAQVRNEVFPAAVREALNVIARLAEEGPTDDELQAVKRQLLGRFTMRLETLEGIVSKEIERVTFELPENYWETYPERLLAVSREDIREILQKWTSPLQVVCVGGFEDREEQPSNADVARKLESIIGRSMEWQVEAVR